MSRGVFCFKETSKVELKFSLSSRRKEVTRQFHRNIEQLLFPVQIECHASRLVSEREISLLRQKDDDETATTAAKNDFKVSVIWFQ
jgi:hypothetical protein